MYNGLLIFLRASPVKLQIALCPVMLGGVGFSTLPSLGTKNSS